jgi:hypothetical protein
MKNNSDPGRCLRRALTVVALTALPAFLLSQNAGAQVAAKPANASTGTNEVGTSPGTAGKPFVNSDKDTTPYDKHDFNGFWARNPSAQYGQPACPECRDPGPSYGFFGDVPPLTPAGQKQLNGNTPTKGYMVGSKQAAERTDLNIAYRKAKQSSESNDPEERCEPLGLTRLLSFSGGNPPMHVVQTNDVIIERFEWFWDNREIWTDGRAMAKVEDYLPRYNGYSVGKWEGDTLVVTTAGFDSHQWVDAFGFPISEKAVLEERWTRPSHNRLRLDMTLTDPDNYTRPWHSNTKVWGLIPKSALTVAGWAGIAEDRCVPSMNNYYTSQFEPNQKKESK